MNTYSDLEKLPQGFTTNLTSPAIRSVVFGGQNVKGWGE
jgi:hypothetical protein